MLHIFFGAPRLHPEAVKTDPKRNVLALGTSSLELFVYLLRLSNISNKSILICSLLEILVEGPPNEWQILNKEYLLWNSQSTSLSFGDPFDEEYTNISTLSYWPHQVFKTHIVRSMLVCFPLCSWSTPQAFKAHLMRTPQREYVSILLIRYVLKARGGSLIRGVFKAWGVE